eukprot:scaffold49089_cov61-Phaeocystis_antarctica.AAC.3
MHSRQQWQTQDRGRAAPPPQCRQRPTPSWSRECGSAPGAPWRTSPEPCSAARGLPRPAPYAAGASSGQV